MMLRLQRERMAGRLVPSVREYFRYFGLDAEKLAVAKPDAIVMHPGPMNRGVEIDSGDRRRRRRASSSEQVEMGVAVRMAVLEALWPRLPNSGGTRRMSAPTRLHRGPRRRSRHAGVDERGAVLVEDGRIVAAGADAAQPGRAGRRRDHRLPRRWSLMPGLVDMRVFIGEPGGEHRETLRIGEPAAAAGGVTTIVMMPDTNPVIDDVALVDFVMRRGPRHGLVNVLPAAAMTRGLDGEEMTEFGLLKEAGAVAFTDGRRSIAARRRAAPRLDLRRAISTRLIVH